MDVAAPGALRTKRIKTEMMPLQMRRDRCNARQIRPGGRFGSLPNHEYSSISELFFVAYPLKKAGKRGLYQLRNIL